MNRVAQLLPSLALLCALSAAPAAQGRTDYLNVESPQVKPLAIATVEGHDYLLVCNTPDNSLEVWDTDESLPAASRFVTRVPVGLEPVTVRVDDFYGPVRFYTANFLGDSITVGRLEGPVGALTALVERTFNAGDEPMDLGFYDLVGTRLVIVSQQSSSSLGIFDALTLAPVVPHVPGATKCDPPALQGSQRLPLVLDTAPAGEPPWGVKEPRALEVVGDRIYTLAFKGGDVRNGSDSDPSYAWNHDLDLMVTELRQGGSFVYPPANAEALPVPYGLSRGIGSTNFNMRFSSNGDLYVVGMEALNFEKDDKIEVRQSPTGFARSTVFRIPGPLVGQGSTVDHSANARDLNLLAPPSTPVAKAVALAMPTDLALLEGPGGDVVKLFVTAYGSDRIGVLAPSPDFATQPQIRDWDRRVIDYASGTTGLSPRFGPRAIVLYSGASGDRLYVLNRFDNSLTIFDANAEVEVETFALRNDPQPDWILEGRAFLYDADQSGHGFVSCATCHTDGRTDALAWRLGNQTPPVGPFEPPPTIEFLFSLMAGPSFPNTLFPGILEFGFFLDMLNAQPPEDPTFDPQGDDDKREMVTQSLQGLVNFEVEPGVKELFDNAPYHWRGDKPSFLDFNEAFVTLMDPSPDPLLDPVEGLTPEEMEAYEEFVFSIHYPPNPQQPGARVPSGDEDCGDGDPLNDQLGGLSGQAFFHEIPMIQSLGGRSCVQCHSLPEGSNNRITLTAPFPAITGYVAEANEQPIESAALRGLLQKEGILQRSGHDSSAIPDAPRVGHFGLNHQGTLQSEPNRPLSINSFIDVFDPDFTFQELNAIKQYVHEFDWGVAPVVGATFTVDPSTDTMQAEAAVEVGLAQARLANCGVAVQGQIGGQRRGWWFVPAFDFFVREPGWQVATLSNLLALPVAPDDRLVFLAVPLGSERRVAHPAGTPPTLPPFVPLDVELLPAVPNTFHASVPTLTDNVIPGTGPGEFPYTMPFFGPLTASDDPFPRTLRLFQTALLGNPVYNLPELRHEAPRRLQVAGRNILPGAVMHLYVPDVDVASASAPPSQWTDANEAETLKITLPIFMTDDVTATGLPIWQTAVELEPLVLYTLMLGGRKGPSVQEAVDWAIWDSLDLASAPPGSFDPAIVPATAVPDPPVWGQPYPPGTSPFDPEDWNWHWVEVENPGSTPGNPLVGDGGRHFQLVLQ